ncbi:hypothetical protein BS50DRAFT_574104 [Corynespora cassiicola Philippines]|uniref:CFEM domain-containing protein n=1 Tax=Corynespora cassiicola Philippines TaxID=1448308 RepID=A0A2T2NPN7_CORCC|nr:hypothetical protein BS50DRAFT_574104 [Corynespora cassiicola Philippines]
MRFLFSAVALVVSFAAVNAQDLSGIPNCALPCFATAVPASGCSISDTECQCTTGRDSITQSITECVPGKCSSEDIASLASAVEGICQRAGVTVSDLPTSVPSGTSGSSNASGTARLTSTGTGSPAQSTGGAAVNAAGMGAVALGVAAVLGF